MSKPAGNSSTRARKYGLEEHFTDLEWETVCLMYGFVCLCCGSDKIQSDHVLPLSRGGKNTIDNIQPLCGLCNSRKGSKHIDYRESPPIYFETDSDGSVQKRIIAIGITSTQKSVKNVTIEDVVVLEVLEKLGTPRAFSGLVEKLLKKWLKSPDKKAQ